MSSIEEAPFVELKDSFAEGEFLLPPPDVDSNQEKRIINLRNNASTSSTPNRQLAPPRISYVTDISGQETMLYTPAHPGLEPITQFKRRTNQRNKRQSIPTSTTDEPPARRSTRLSQPQTLPSSSTIVTNSMTSATNSITNSTNLSSNNSIDRSILPQQPTTSSLQSHNNTIIRNNINSNNNNIYDNNRLSTVSSDNLNNHQHNLNSLMANNSYNWAPQNTIETTTSGNLSNFTTFSSFPRVQNIDWRARFVNPRQYYHRHLISNNNLRPVAPPPAHSIASQMAPIVARQQAITSFNNSHNTNSNFAHQQHSYALSPASNQQQSIPRLEPKATKVRPDVQDFLIKIQQLIPSVDADRILNQLINNPSYPVSIPVPPGSDAIDMQKVLEDVMSNTLYNLNAPTQAPRTIPNELVNTYNSLGFQPPNQAFLPPYNAPYIRQPPPQQQSQHYQSFQQQQQIRQQPPPRPSEDDMAKQDEDADVGQDDDYVEVETYADYIPAKLKIGQAHPDPVVETSSLSAVEPPDITYDLKLPSKVIDKAYLSALQLESVIYASQQHNQLLPDNRTRRGFLIGDGAGVGKGRTIAGIIYENFLCGRKKSIWLSVSTDLKLDAERDLKDIGAKIPVYLLGKFVYGRRINVDSGVIFTTYSGLVSKSQSVRGNLGNRLGQLIAWAGDNFDGVIVFDECHKAKNIAMTSVKKKQSKAAEFALELQKKLPKARVVYASATGASETKHLGYMTRLGIWGEGTPYREFTEFCGAIEKRGVGAMELVAVDLKTRGSYIARQLSFKTTSFEIDVAKLDESFIKIYDESVNLWSKTLKHFKSACNFLDQKKTRILWTSFWAAHQRFFKYLCIGAKVPIVIDIARRALNEDKCVVIGLQSTGESKTNEALEDGEINEFISTARATYESLVDNYFPIPDKYRRTKTKAAVKKINSPAAKFLSSNPIDPVEIKTPSETSSSTIDDSYHSHEEIRFLRDEGRVRAELDEQKASKTSRPTRNSVTKKQQILNELARETRSKAVTSSRTLRARKRALERGDKIKSKSRVCLLKDDSDDTEISNPLSCSSSDGLLTTTTTSTVKEGNDDSDDFIVDDSELDQESTDDDDDDEDEEFSSDDTTIQDDKKNATKRKPSSSNIKGEGDKEKDSDDSDCQITGVKIRKKNPEVIFLSSDDDEELVDEKNLDKDNLIIKHGDQLKKMRDELINMIEELGPRLPNNTLDDLIDRLGGPSKVAEMTGRKGRVVKDEDGLISYKQRNEAEHALEDLNIIEKQRFMSGKKLIAIISEAASSGISLQADKRVENQKRRVHITIELPWSADRAIQQFGRTHRSNQVVGPQYVFVISELAGEKRFASIVAKRLESLGALTHGDRRANTDTRDLSQFNIVGRFCKPALERLCDALSSSKPDSYGIKPHYEPVYRFIQDAREGFVDAGLADCVGHHFSPDKNALQVNHFLNRLLGMKVGIQNALFKFFIDHMEKLITHKKILGQYDSGILELNSDSGKTKISEPEHYSLLTKSGIVKCELRNVQVERGISWDEAQSLLESRSDCSDSRQGYYISTNPKTKAVLIQLLLREPTLVDTFRAYKPNVGRAAKALYYSLCLKEDARKCDPKDAEPVWSRIFSGTDTKCVHLCLFNHCSRIDGKHKCDVGLRHRKYCILTGGILTAWPYLEQKLPEATKKLQIIRLKLDKGNRVIGPIIPQENLDQVRKELKKGEEGVKF